MKKSGRKVLSVILAAVMVFALLPIISRPMVVEAETTLPTNHTHGEHADGTCSDHVGWRAISTQDELKTLCEGGGKGYLKKNIDVTELIKVSGEKEVSICLNGYSIIQNSNNDVFYVEGTLNLFDESDNFGKITHYSDFKGRGVYVGKGTFNLFGGKISENNNNTTGDINYSCGGGVYVDSNGTFNMNGGIISGNTVNKVTIGELIFTGDGGGVYVDEDGTFTMNGGEISGNAVDSQGGGVCVERHGKFTINGGKISENDSVRFGGGVQVYGTFIMTGGEISGNTSFDAGGVNVNGTFTMTGGEISGNTGVYGIGGLLIAAENFTMEGGKIHGNIGGGVSLLSGTYTMIGGEIYGNSDFYGVYTINWGTFNMTGGKISGGAYLDYNSIITDEGIIDEIKCNDNTAKITFNSNEINSKITSQYICKGEDTKLTPNQFTNVGKKFVEWNTFADGSGDSYSDEAQINRDSDLTLYAQWIDPDVESYNVTFKVENGAWSDGSKDDITVPLSRNQNEDKLLRLSESDIPSVGSNSEPGFKAGSWDVEPTTGKVINENATYTYTYASDPDAVKYTITLDANGGTVNETSAETGYDHKLTSLPSPEEREGYGFVGWFSSAEAGTEITTDTVFDSNDTIYALWNAHSYSIKFDTNGGCGTMDDMSRKYDDNIALTSNAFTYESHTFSGWNTQADGNGTSYANESCDNITSEDGITVTLYAQWDAIFYDINTSDDGNGSASVSATSGIKGTNITLTATPNEGYRFSRWEIVSGEATINDASSATTTLLIGTSDVEVKAEFEEIPEETEITEPKPQPGSDEPTELKPTEPETVEPLEPEPTEPETVEPTEPQPTEPEVPEEPAPEPEPEVEIPDKDWLDDLRLALNIAAELGGAQTVEYSGDFALSYDIMNYLVEHPSITFVYHVTYEDVEYTIVIPAGKAVSSTKIPWYGPLWLLANYGNENNK